MFLSFGNGCQSCLPNWQASHTHVISFSVKVGSLMTTPFDCIPLSFWRLMWQILLCHSSMSASTLWPFENMPDFTSFDLRINIRPSLRPDELPFILNEATTLVESDLHALLHDLADRYQILRYGRNIQVILDVGFVVTCHLSRMGNCRHVKSYV